MNTQARFDRAWSALARPPGLVLVGVSGGPDSLALLLLLHTAAARFGHRLLVVHADHGLHPDSGRVATMVTERAGELGVEAIVSRLDLPVGSGESAARLARQSWFTEQLRTTGAHTLALAHHREDQAETVLLRVMAGSGPAGLAGISAVRGRVVRPLLGFRREELARVVEGAGWEPWEDPANTDLRHDRSWVRHRLLPMLQERQPRVVEHLLRLADQAGTQRRGWDALLDRLEELDLRTDRGVVSVAADPLKGYDSDLARTVLQALARRQGLTLGPRAAVRWQRLLLAGRSGRWVPLAQGWRGVLAHGRVRLEPPGGVSPSGEFLIGGGRAGAVQLGLWRVRWRHEIAPPMLGREGWTSWFLPGEYTLRVWRAGDRIRPLGGTGQRLVVRCMQDRKVPSSERSGWPVITDRQGATVWVPGVMRSHAAIPAPATEGVRVDVEHA